MNELNPYNSQSDPLPLPIEVFTEDDFIELEIARDSLPGLDAETGVTTWLLDTAAYLLLTTSATASQVAPTVEFPRVVFGDLRRPQHDESFCYCGNAGDYTTEAKLADGSIGLKLIDGVTGQVTLAYGMRLDPETILITRFGMRDRELSEPLGYPADHLHDFGKKLWPR